MTAYTWRKNFLRLTLLMAGALCSAAGLAHEPGLSKAAILVDGDQLSASMSIARPDIELLTIIDRNYDDAISVTELAEALPALAELAPQMLRFPGLDPLIQIEFSNENDSLYFNYSAEVIDNRLLIDAPVLRRLPRGHRIILGVKSANTLYSHDALLSADMSSFSFDLSARGSRRSSFTDFLREGIWHIWQGFDHLAFLFLLLLPAIRHQSHRIAIWDVVRIASAFAVAHSITLSLAGLGFISLPAKLIEMAIAGSVVFAAVINYLPRYRRYTWMLAFGFGLIHGFGFAGALSDLSLERGLTFLSLVGFNLGVELGQLVIIGTVLPLLRILVSNAVHRRRVVPAGSATIAIFGVIWLVERAIN